MIRLEHVSKTYKTSTRPALEDVSVSIGKGEFVFLIGPSGSGKSTFLRLLLREDVPSRGRVFVADWNVAKLPRRRVPRLRQRIGCVFQDFRLLNNKTVAENVAFALEVIGKPRHTIRKVVPEVLQLVGLDGKADRMPHELSGGEQQRVAIARALAMRPDVLLLDEVTSALDPELAAEVLDVLRDLARTSDITMLCVTHAMRFARDVSHRVLMFDRGHVVEDKPPEELFEHPEHERTRAFLRSVLEET